MAGNLTAMIAAIFSGSAVSTDPYFNLTTLLLSTTATNGQQNNTFQDSSTNNFTITRNGNTTQGTFSPFSQTGWGNYFNGGANYLNVAAASSIDLASSNFTIECWAFPGTQTNAVDSVFGYGGFTTMLYRNGTTWSWEVGNGTSSNYFTITATCTPNTWQHIALTRSGNTFTFWINGVSAGTNSTSNAVGTASKNLTIGYNNNPPNAQYFTGYISNFRIVKGTAVYTSAFTPPTSPLTDITNTSLLTCQSNRFIDTNTQLTAKTITVTGSPSVVPFSPFNPTSAWSASTVGGSGYFDGTGDYLTVPDNAAFTMGNGDFTLEAWVYVTATPGSQLIFGTCDSAGSQGSMSFVLGAQNSSGFPFIGVGYLGTLYRATSSEALVKNQWNHIAGVRNGATVTIYVNGVSKGTLNMGTLTITDSSQVVGIGRNGAGNFEYLTGNIASARIVKGTAVYTGNFTPPTAPITTAGSTSAASYPSTTNVNTSFVSSATSLLLNFTNAGIYDATAKNVLETVGNAQVSTTQSKWSPTSMYFDGTGDYLLLPDNPYQRIGTGNFTVECWVYRNSSGTYGLIGKGTGTTGWLLSLNSSNQVVFTYGSSTITSTGTVSATTWTHIAVVRSGTSTNQTKIYISGTNDGTGTVSTDFNQTNEMYVAADRTAGSNANAYVQDARVTRYARYTANFTPPTAAFPVQ